MTMPVLLTERLLLRPLRSEDAEAWYAFHADPVTMRHLGGVQPRSVAWRGLCAMAGAWSIRGFSMFAVTLRDTGEWIGRVGPWQPEGWPGTEIGWGLASRFAGQGFAREAAVATIDYAVDVLGWTDIIHTIAPDNSESIALAQRLGSTNRGPTRLPAPLAALPVDDWGQSAADWRTRRAADG
jgi:RimJ/RimL family protein N-acetyltransferase